MKGTEKQIKWALDIQARLISALNWGIANFPDKAAFVAKCEQIKSAVKSVEYAGDLIAVYSSVNGSSDEENLKTISGIIGAAKRFGIRYDTPAQNALVGK